MVYLLARRNKSGCGSKGLATAKAGSGVGASITPLDISQSSGLITTNQ